MPEGVERSILLSVDPDADDLARARESNIETRSDGSSSSASDVVRYPSAEGGEASKDASRANAEKSVTDAIALGGQSS